ncbi:putative phosphate ABC transporter permease protein [Oscillibacter valericigenes Sjm18-20]|nr:putative phosphate ABC transporter permease protein [Oscillibacter valericigenes Sjm18-20]
MNTTHSLRARQTDRIMTGIFYCVGGFFLLLLLVLAGYILISGFSALQPGLLAFNKNGIGNQFFDTVYLVFLSLLISVPIGIAAGIYMAEYAHPGRTTRFLRVSIEALSSLPSIVVGLFGYLVFILVTGGKWNLLSPTCPLNPFRPGETLALHIWAMRTEGSLYANSTEIANFSAAVLILMVFGFSILARLISRSPDKKMAGQAN